MKYDRFENVPVWNDSAELAVAIFELTEDPAFNHKGDIANQLQRAALSVSNNIAEGFERGTTQELITFLYYARGSAGEVRSILIVSDRMKPFRHLKFQISDLRSKAESVSRQVRAWADSLQNTEIKGQRYLNDRTRSSYETGKRTESFFAKIKQINDNEAEKRGKTRKEPEQKTPE